MRLKVYDMEGKEVEEVDVDDVVSEISVKGQTVKDYLVALRANKRQWSANTKERSEIGHSGFKPRAQKGTGRARQGTIKAPQYRGGATVFGPKPKFDQHIRINRKERRSVIRFLLAEKCRVGRMHGLRIGAPVEGKTKKMAVMLGAIGLQGKKVLCLGKTVAGEEENRRRFCRSMRNIPGMRLLPYESLNGYDLINADELLVSTDALPDVLSNIKGMSDA
ncbi:MAG: 50S ribosomal protein L4 [Simkaniaceae bacterium]|nr:50S ribosomal protein L4 [Simkaniaceae bacterium]